MLKYLVIISITAVVSYAAGLLTGLWKRAVVQADYAFVLAQRDKAVRDLRNVCEEVAKLPAEVRDKIVNAVRG